MRTGADGGRGHNTRTARGGAELRGRPWILIPSLLALALAAALVVGVVVAVVAWLNPIENQPSASPASAASAPPSTENAPVRPAALLSETSDTRESARSGGDTAPRGKSGIGVFPPAGTEPLKRGLIVPEGFELPPGYVRHYQVTDDGQRVPPILMFHPDYHPTAPDGRPIPLPADRIVPPELAPPGFPIESAPPPGNGKRDKR